MPFDRVTKWLEHFRPSRDTIHSNGNTSDITDKPIVANSKLHWFYPAWNQKAVYPADSLDILSTGISTQTSITFSDQKPYTHSSVSSRFSYVLAQIKTLKSPAKQNHKLTEHYGSTSISPVHTSSNMDASKLPVSRITSPAFCQPKHSSIAGERARLKLQLKNSTPSTVPHIPKSLSRKSLRITSALAATSASSSAESCLVQKETYDILCSPAQSIDAMSGMNQSLLNHTTTNTGPDLVLKSNTNSSYTSSGSVLLYESVRMSIKESQNQSHVSFLDRKLAQHAESMPGVTPQKSLSDLHIFVSDINDNDHKSFKKPGTISDRVTRRKSSDTQHTSGFVGTVSKSNTCKVLSTSKSLNNANAELLEANEGIERLPSKAIVSHQTCGTHMGQMTAGSQLSKPGFTLTELPITASTPEGISSARVTSVSLTTPYHETEQISHSHTDPDLRKLSQIGEHDVSLKCFENNKGSLNLQPIRIQTHNGQAESRSNSTTSTGISIHSPLPPSISTSNARSHQSSFDFSGSNKLQRESVDKIEARKRRLVASSKRMMTELEELKYDKLLASIPRVRSYYEINE